MAEQKTIFIAKAGREDTDLWLDTMICNSEDEAVAVINSEIDDLFERIRPEDESECAENYHITEVKDMLQVDIPAIYDRNSGNYHEVMFCVRIK